MRKFITLIMVCFMFLVASFSVSAYEYSPEQKKKVSLLWFKAGSTPGLSAFEDAQSMIWRLRELKTAGNLPNLTEDEILNIQPVIVPNHIEWANDELNELQTRFKDLKNGTTPETVAAWNSYKEDLESVLPVIDRTSANFQYALALMKFVLKGEETDDISDGFPQNIRKSNAIIVTNSQGNIIFDEVYKAYLADKPELIDNYRVLSIGSPIKLTHYDRHVLDGSDFVSPLDGLVINTVNDDPFWTEFSVTGHSFTDYMNGSASGPAIDDFLKTSVDNMDFTTEQDEFASVYLSKPWNIVMKLIVQITVTTVESNGDLKSETYTVAPDSEYFSFHPDDPGATRFERIGTLSSEEFYYVVDGAQFIPNTTKDVAYVSEINAFVHSLSINHQPVSLTLRTPVFTEEVDLVIPPQKSYAEQPVDYTNMQFVRGVIISHLPDGSFDLTVKTP
ncbi:MAG: hypothetical protein GY793_06090 [Proteobacteria bacterium]|nr:hypothetical protein [Pseudomonadota bacterium]